MDKSENRGSTEQADKTGAWEFALAAAEMAYNTRCEDVVLLDLRGRSPVTEFFVIATGSSPRQMRTVVEEIKDLGKKMGFKAWQTSGMESGRWILVDCVNVVCHVFDHEGREFYDLELLWGDCPRVDWRKELGLPAVTEAELAGRRRFSEGSHLDQIDAQEQEDQDVTEEEVEQEDEDGEAEVDLPVVVEMAEESGDELVEIDPPEKRGKRRSALYPTPIREASEADGEHAVHVMTMREAAEASIDEDAVPARKKRKGAKKIAKKVVKKRAAVKKKKAVAKKKGVRKKKSAAKRKVAGKKKAAKKKR